LDVIRPLAAALISGVLLALAVVMVRSVLAVARGQRTDAAAHLATIRSAYLVLLVTILLFPKRPFDEARPLRDAFRDFYAWPPKPLEFGLNVVLLVPLGAFVCLAYRRKQKRALWLLAIPYVCELLQGFVGQLHRALTAADMVAYAIGIAVGGAVCAFVTQPSVEEHER
jgi:hypothetical protein